MINYYSQSKLGLVSILRPLVSVLRLILGLVGRLVFIIFSLTIVLDVSNIAIIAIDRVGHSLGAAIRKEDIVATVGVVTLTVLVGSKVDLPAIVISIGLDVIVVLVLGWLLIFVVPGLVSRLVSGLVRGLVGRSVSGPVI